MPIRLVSVDGGPEIALDRPAVVVGRHRECDVRLLSVRVSRRHCCITEFQGEVLVRDLGSTNGTRINGYPVQIGWLRPGDELAIGNVRYQLERDPPAPSLAG